MDAEPTSVSVGDPIALEVTIFGPEPMAGVAFFVPFGSSGFERFVSGL